MDQTLLDHEQIIENELKGLQALMLMLRQNRAKQYYRYKSRNFNRKQLERMGKTIFTVLSLEIVVERPLDCAGWNRRGRP